MITTKAKKWILKRKTEILMGTLAFSLLLISFITTPLTAYAWSWDDVLGISKDIDQQQAIEFLSNEWIEYASLIGSIIQSIGGWIIKGLYVLVSSIEGLIPQTFSLFDLLEDAGLNEFASSIIEGLFFAILVLVITWLGIRTIIHHKPPRFKSVTINVIVMIGLLGGLNELMANMQEMSVNFYKGATEGENTKEGLAWSLVQYNTADLVYLSQTSFDPIKEDNDSATTSSQPKNGLTPEMFLQADLGDLVTPEVVEKLEDESDVPEETKYLSYKVTNDGSKETLEEIDSSLFNPFSDMIDSGYIRYPMNWFTIFFSLLSLGVAYVFTLFIFVTTIFEIAMKKIVAPFVFVTDIETGQKTKMVLQDIFTGFLGIAFTGLSLGFYTIVVNYLANADINAVLYVVSMICLTMALIKGSESIMKYFGVDVGLKDGKNHLMGAIGALTTANALRKGVSNMGRDAVDKLKGGSQQSREDTPKRSEGSLDDPDDAHLNENEQGNGVPNSLGGMKKMARNTGAALGYMKNRGASGMLTDAGFKATDSVSDVLDKGKDTVSGVANDMKDGAMSTVEEFKDGQAEGHQLAQKNADRQTLGNVGKELLRNVNSGEEHSTGLGVQATPQNMQRDLSVQGNMNNTGAIVPNDEESQGIPENVQRDVNVLNNIGGTGAVGSPGSGMNVNPQNVQRELSVQGNMNNTGAIVPNDEESQGISENVQRDVNVLNNIGGTGAVGNSGLGMNVNPQNVQRELSVQGNMNSNGAVVPNDAEAKGISENVQRDVNVLNNIGGTGAVGNPGSEMNINPQTAQREVNVQNSVRDTGAAGNPGSEMNVNPQTAQREVNVQNNVRDTGAAGNPGSEMNVNPQTAQREVNVQNNVRDTGAVGNPGSEMRGTSQTVQRDVNMQNNVRSTEPVGSEIRGTSQTVQREVNVQNNVRDTETVDTGVRGTSQTVQRDVNMQNNVRGTETVDSEVRGTSQTVQREVNVQNNMRGTETIDSEIRGTSQTVQREVNAQNNIRDNSKPRFRQRGSEKNRVDILQGK